LTVRERITALVDVGSFRESGRIAGGAVVEGSNLVELTPSNFVLGTAKVNRRPIVVGGEDFTIKGWLPHPAES
jgi:acetyl-CoA carboxylase carboxyltransferase component